MAEPEMVGTTVHSKWGTVYRKEAGGWLQPRWKLAREWREVLLSEGPYLQVRYTPQSPQAPHDVWTALSPDQRVAVCVCAPALAAALEAAS